MVRHTSMSILLQTLVLTLLASQTDSAVLSRNKVITSSSIYLEWVPQKALNGDSRRDANTCHCCAATKYEFTPWYQLDLGKLYTVTRVQVEGRNDFEGLHFQGMWIYMKRVNDGLELGEETRITEATYNVDYVLPVPKSTRYVSLALYDITNRFAICEMTVYGECDVGESGDYCEGICHCDGDQCYTGVCPSEKCIPGYEGKACDKECTDGTYGPGCTESCGNCSGSTNICNKQNGICPSGCAIGYQGDTCKQQCAGGFYGQGCRYVCGHCEDGTPCHRVTGHCENGCAAGYKNNALCETACDDGTYGENCISNCGSCLNGAACNTRTGVCGGGCSAGYTGDLCVDKCPPGLYGSGCNSRCGNCTADAVCHHSNGTCIEGCKKGFKKPLCQEECDDGTYGLDCLKTCGRCFGNEPCDKENGTCSGCEKGFTGDYCKSELSDEECDAGFYGPGCVLECGNCLNGDPCDKTLGYCIYGCSEGYQPDHFCKTEMVDNAYLSLAISGWVCVGIVVLASAVGIFVLMRRRKRSIQKKARAASHMYEIPTTRNVDEEHPYSSTEVNTQDRVYTNTDFGQVDSAWTKSITSSSVHPGPYAARNAIDGNLSRHHQTCWCCAGTSNALNRYYVLDFGENHTVYRIHVEGRNDTPNHGQCTEGTFGGYCEGICHCDGETCNTTSGVCLSGKCLPGYYGTACDKECSDGTYGAGCTEKCGNCVGNNICYKEDGRCPGQCASGYQGNACKQKCDDGFYGQGCTNTCGHCHNGEPCNAVTGHCENGCAAGYQIDSLCKTECTPGTYGKGCSNTCGNCKGGIALCAKSDGFCPAGCVAGYKGGICKTGCDGGTYGENCNSKCGSCLSGAACNTKTGVCGGGCSAGYTGDLCVDKCLRGSYSIGCGSKCENCMRNTCHHMHGACVGGCTAGFKAPLCQEECDAGFYGPGCVLECGNCFNGDPCDKMLGYCIYGCSEGYQPDFLCKTEIQNENVDNDYLTFAISGWVCVGIVLVSAVGFFVLMRKRNRANKKEVRTVSRLYEIPTIRNNPVIEEHLYGSTEVNTQDHVYTNTESS